jgi:protein-disulfide isomerase
VAATQAPEKHKTCEHCSDRRVAVVPSAAIADFDPPDVDACFVRILPSDSEKRMDLSLSLSHEAGIATVTDAKLKYASEALANAPGLVDCVRRALVGRDLPFQPSPGPAEVALLVSDSQIPVTDKKVPPSTLHTDRQAPSLGEAGASLTVSVFTDFQCPFCGQYAARLHSLVELYPGQLRVEVRNFPLPFHPAAELAAEAALAAHEQGKFWPMHDQLFANQTSIDRDRLRAFAKEIGLDVDRFEQALADGHEASRVRDDIEAGKRLGVRGVPAMVIGDDVVTGSMPVEELARHIDRALAARAK